MDKWLLDNLVCPKHKRELNLEGNYLVCPENERFLVVDGIPVLLFDDGNPTHGYITNTLKQVSRIEAGEPVENVVQMDSKSTDGIDEFVKGELPYTCGYLYIAIKDKLTRYPFPDLRLPDGNGRRLLDIGCGWGRWTIPAEQKGYRSVGIDPNLNAVLAARRIARQFGVEPNFVVADALSLPFANDCIDVVFSYSIIHHLKKANAKKVFSEASRVSVPGGEILIQMANKYGLRCLYHQIRLGFKDGVEGSTVFYWTPNELMRTFEEYFGKTEMTVDCFFGLNMQKNDLDIMPFSHRVYIRSSEFFRAASRAVPQLINVADSIYLNSLNQKSGVRGNKVG